MAVWQQAPSLTNNNTDGAVTDKFKLAVKYEGHPLKSETD